jgi:polyferredoxin
MSTLVWVQATIMGTQTCTAIIPQDSLAVNNAPLGETPLQSASSRAKKRLVRRTDRDYSQRLRRGCQFAFFLLNAWLGGQFYLWVRHFETGGQSAYFPRPSGVEGWLPIAGMMNLKYFLTTWHVPALHPAAMFLLVTFLAIAFLFRKAFCSWLCPVGTISEYLWRAGKKFFGRNLHLPRWLDLPLRGLKYLLLGFFVWAVSSMSAGSIAAFMRSPYGIVADVKMLNFFRFIGHTGLIVLGVLVMGSVLVQNFWCRYLCPYGALLGLTSIFSPLRIRRNADACIDCAKCAKACPSALPVDKLITIKSAECIGCLECVAVCPAEGALQMGLPQIIANRTLKNGRMPTWAFAAGVAVLFLGIVGLAKTAGYWNSEVPRAVYQQLVPHANEASHPMPGDPALQE